MIECQQLSVPLTLVVCRCYAKPSVTIPIMASVQVSHGDLAPEHEQAVDANYKSQGFITHKATTEQINLYHPHPCPYPTTMKKQGSGTRATKSPQKLVFF